MGINKIYPNLDIELTEAETEDLLENMHTEIANLVAKYADKGLNAEYQLTMMLISSGSILGSLIRHTPNMGQDYLSNSIHTLIDSTNDIIEYEDYTIN